MCRSIADATTAELRSVLVTVNDARSAQSTASDPEFGDLPLAVAASNAFGDKWIEFQREVARRSTAGTFHATETRSHNIHLRHPDLVVDVIADMLRRAAVT